MYYYFKQIFFKPKNLFIVLFIFLFLFFIFSALPNYEIILNFIFLDSIPFVRKVGLIFEYSFVGLFATSLLSFFITLFTTLFLSLNIVLFYFFYKRQEVIFKNKGFIASILGIFLSLFGVGCLSCGALLIAPLFSFFGIASVLDFLPFGGVGIAILGLVLTIFSFFYLLHQISKPLTCK